MQLSLMMLLLVMASHFFAAWADRYVQETLRRSVATSVVALEDMAEHGNNNGKGEYEEKTFQERVTALGRGMEARLTLIRRDGCVLADSDYDPATLESHADREEFRETLAGHNIIIRRWSATQKQPVIYLTALLSERFAISPGDAGDDIAAPSDVVLRVAMPIGQIESELRHRNLEILLFSAPLWFAATLAGAWFLSRHFAEPVQRLAESVRRLAGGDLNARSYYDDSREFQQIGESFTSLADEVRRSCEDLDSQRRTLDGILETMQQPLAVIDSNQCIRFVNTEFRRIFCDSPSLPPTGSPSTEVLPPTRKADVAVFRSPEFESLHRRVSTTGLPDQVELGWMNSTFLLRIGAIPRLGMEVCVFSDVTQLAELAQRRRDLVTNASHELRTPLAAIQGFVETLLEEETDESRRGYLEIIHRHSVRLSRLTNDFLTLGELENHRYTLEYNNIFVQKMTDDIVRLLRPRLREKSLDFIAEIEPGLTFRADPFRMEQLLLNLLDNAIKYTPCGSVGLRAAQHDEKVVLEIHDTGIGIPVKDCERIFERFYVVDKSRSRSMGGTGLGLTIVRHIVLLHHGRISVRSHPNSGTTFTISLPATEVRS
jgi:Signal transduction histidine kinase